MARFFTALVTASGSVADTDSTASISTPAAAPKYPAYRPTSTTATASSAPDGPAPVAAARRSASARSRSRASSTEPSAISQGTTSSKTPSGVLSSSAAPRVPPTAASATSLPVRRRWPRSSARDPAAAPTVVENSATVLVTLAATGGSPTASSAG
ncbi:hypothetical protein GCM10022416_10010 [Actinomadura keratinilytica]|uniref:Uncharacterized protein n=1 Tax=Actinomadura keratinilytica TaxID=547461 RepID=A0ABP7Y650_9ACTN